MFRAFVTVVLVATVPPLSPLVLELGRDRVLADQRGALVGALAKHSASALVGALVGPALLAALRPRNVAARAATPS